MAHLADVADSAREPKAAELREGLNACDAATLLKVGEDAPILALRLALVRILVHSGIVLVNVVERWRLELH